MKSAVFDEVVHVVLRRHQIVKPSVSEHVEAALEGVRPMLALHGGDVELVTRRLQRSWEKGAVMREPLRQTRPWNLTSEQDRPDVAVRRASKSAGQPKALAA